MAKNGFGQQNGQPIYILFVHTLLNMVIIQGSSVVRKRMHFSFSSTGLVNVKVGIF